MTSLGMVFLLVAAGPSEPVATVQRPVPSAQASEVPSDGPRTGRELSEAVQAALRRWARPSAEHSEQAAWEFLGLYRELEQDRSLGTATRRELRVKVRARLAQLAGQIAGRLPEKEQEPKPSPPKTIALPADQPQRLAQLAPPARRPPQGRRATGAGAAVGPRGRGLSGRAASSQNFGPLDSAWQLVELIQRTIAPSTWDVNGGPGTIDYWSPGHALVVRQTSDVHGDVADLLEQLERMGR